MEIGWIRRQIAGNNYEFSGHADDERQAERIAIADVEAALRRGEILEDYPNDPRGPSCLVLHRLSDTCRLRAITNGEVADHHRLHTLAAEMA